MFGVGGDLCGSSSATYLLKQGHLQQAAQDLVQAGFEYLQRRRLHNVSGQPAPVLSHVLYLLEEKNSFVSAFHINLHCLDGINSE